VDLVDADYLIELEIQSSINQQTTKVKESVQDKIFEIKQRKG
jgi:hypothetical protein